MDGTVVEQLKSFGLTEYQSKALATLFTKGESSAKDISSYGGIPETKVYAVLDSLDDMGFVKATLGRPKRYASIRPQDIIERLVEKQRSIVHGLEGRKDNVISELSGIYDIGASQGRGKREIYTRGSYSSWRELARRTAKAEKYVYLMGDCVTFEGGFDQSDFLEALIGRAEAGLEMRVLFPIDFDIRFAVNANNDAKRRFLSMYAKPNVKIRVSRTPFNLSASIMDDADVGISIHMQKGLWDSFYTRDEKLAKDLKDHFTTIWDSAQDVNSHLLGLMKEGVKSKVSEVFS